MMIRRVLVLIALLLLAGFSGAKGMGMIRSRVLEAESTLNFKVIYPVEGSVNKLNIKGIASDSAYGIKKITCNVKKEKMIVKVYLSLVSKDSGYLDYTVVIPSSVNEVLFGNKLKKIWERQPTPREAEGSSGSEEGNP